MAVYKRGRVWWMNFWEGNLHVQRTTKCKNRRDAETVERAFRTQLAKGEVGIKPKKSAPFFQDAIKDFLAWAKFEHALKPNTYIRYETATKTLERFFKNARLDHITSREIEKFKVWRSQQVNQPRGVKPKNPKPITKAKTIKKPIAPATVNKELAVLKKMFNRLKDELQISNPVSKVKFLKEENIQEYSLSYENEKIYLMACSQPLRDFAIVMIETGLRPDEVRNLTINDIDLNKGYLQVVKGKTNAARRKVPLSEAASKVFESRIKNAESKFIFSGVRGENKLNTPVVKLNNAHYGALKRSKLDKFRLYDLRHTFATRQVQSGTDLVTLAALLGHSKLDMVLRYAHPSENHKFEAIKRMDAKRESQLTNTTSKAA
jgi:integrase